MNNGGLKTDSVITLSKYCQIPADKSQQINNPQGRARPVKPPRIPPMVTDIIQTALASLDGMEFAELISCPLCGGPVQGHDSKKKKFAVLREQTGERIITVRVKRFYCGRCGNLCYADQPFYPDTRIGSPVIDLFSSLSATMPPSRAARVIDTMGIVVDRTTWRNYAGLPFPIIPVVDVFGMRLPLCVMRLSDIAVTSGESGHADPADVLAACGYPSRSKATTGTSREIE
jgi:hypothetical protein